MVCLVFSDIDQNNAAAPASPLGAIQPDLYRGQEGPVYINAPDDSLAFGKLHFYLKYDSHLCDLTVHIIEGLLLLQISLPFLFNHFINFSIDIFCEIAHNLCSIVDDGFRAPLVCLMLNPEVDNRKRETTTARGDEHHPYFDQHFKFPVSRDQLSGKELVLQVMDCDRYSHSDAMGEVRINIDEMDLSKSVEVRE